MPAWLSGTLMLIALLQVPVTIWVVYRRTRPTKGVVRGLVTGGSFATMAFLALAIGSVSTMSDEAKARQQAAREAREHEELVAKQRAALVAASAKAPGDGLQSADKAKAVPVSMTAREDARAQSVAEADTDNWYVLGGQITEAAILGTGPVTFACQEDKGPGATLESLGPFGAEVRLEDKEVVAGKPVVVVFDFRGNKQLFIRGQRRCERMAAIQTSQSAQAFAMKKKETDRYK